MPQVGTSGLDRALELGMQLAGQIAEPLHIDAWLRAMGVSPSESTVAAILQLSTFDLPQDLVTTLLNQTTQFFHEKTGLENALPNLVRFLERVRSPLALATLFERDTEALPVLLRVLSVRGPLAEIIIEDVESFDLLRLVQGRAISREALLADLQNELCTLEHSRNSNLVLRRFRNREFLRIGYGLLSGNANATWAHEQLTQVATVLCSAAFELVLRRSDQQFAAKIQEMGIVFVCFGPCGANQMDFRSSLPLMVLFQDTSASRNSRSEREGEAERFTRMALAPFIGMEKEAFGVQIRSWPDFDATQHSFSVDHALRTLDQVGRTWQRLEMMSASIVAGAAETGSSFISQMEPWLYRRRLSDADVDGLYFQYHRWKQISRMEGLEGLLSGIRILQLTLGGDHPQVRSANPCAALNALAHAGAWKKDEAHVLAQDLEALQKMSLLEQLGACQNDSPINIHRLATAHHLIESALDRTFGDTNSLSPFADLVMDPRLNETLATTLLAPLGFPTPIEAAVEIRELANELSPFLSTRKSRHFLAQIAPTLIHLISETPLPAQTLFTLSRVVNSLGAKGALWELFLASPSSMELCVRICAYAPHLSNILVASPGLIDELLDSLQLARLPSLAAMESRLDDLCKGAELEQAIHEFKNTLHLRIGVRDILGKEQIASTHQALAQTSESILRRVVSEQVDELTLKHGPPVLESNEGSRKCRHVVLVAGKVGGLEPNYHSEVEFAVIYEGDGMTAPASRSMPVVSCAHFFGQVTQRTTRKLTSRGKLGQLFVVSNEFRPLGSQGPLAASLDAINRHYFEAPRPWRDLLWICKARPIGGDVALATDVMGVFQQILAGARISPADIDDFRSHRIAQQDQAKRYNLKRAAGGTLQIELLVQLMQLAYAASHPKILAPGTLAAIERLGDEKLLSVKEVQFFSEKYRFLRTIESRLRLMNLPSRHDLPEHEAELRSLAMFVGVESASKLVEQCEAAMGEVNMAIEACEVRLAKARFI